jgi:hypothetical protein
MKTMVREKKWGRKWQQARMMLLQTAKERRRSSAAPGTTVRKGKGKKPQGD